MDNNDCGQHDACINYHCVNPCSLPNACGQKADCVNSNHNGICTCQPGYTGDPQLGCVLVQYCAADNQCPSGTKCSNGVCSCKYKIYKLLKTLCVKFLFPLISNLFLES